MSHFERILCPVDFSESSRHAALHAVALAAWYHAGLTALHVSNGGLGDGAEDRLRAEVLSLFPSEGAGTSLDVRVDTGHPVDVILQSAAAWSADAIVMGTHGIRGFERLVLGSVTEKVLRKASCPVFTVPPRAAATSSLPFKEILCAVDFSASADKAAVYALSLAEEAAAHLTLLHVLEWPWHEPPAPAFDELPPEQARQLLDFRRAREASAAERLKSLVPATNRHAVHPSTRIVHGKAYTEILRCAADSGADLVVVGVHGHAALELALLGSTTNQVVRQATCPVLTVRPS